MFHVTRRSDALFVWICALGTLLLVGCTDGSLPTSQSGENCVGKCDEIEGSAEQQLEAHYLMAINADLTVAESDDPSEPESFKSRLVGIVDVERSDGEATMTLRPCLVELPSVDGKQPYIPHEVVQRTHFSVFDATVQGDALRTSAGTVLGGVTLTNPVTDPLPADGDDSEVWDVDDDGEPGLTVTLDGWEIYMGIRLKFSLEGRFETERNGWISGDAVLGLDLEIYGDNIPFVSARNRIGGLLEEIEILETLNAFEMRPIDASLATCDVAVDPSLIPEEPPAPADANESDDGIEPPGENGDQSPDVPAN